ncbi:MAG: DinB family protein [Bacteroidetes bacterium]|nr:DinB family protein [Bacteroidota bacterium]
MQSTLEKKYQILVNNYDQLLNLCEKLDYAGLNDPITSGKWSVAQILTHINISISITTAYLVKKIQYPEKIPNTNFTTGLRSVLLNAALRSDIKFKAPKVVSAVPEINSIEKIEFEWQTQKKLLFDLLESFPPHLLNKAVFRHPLAGRITLKQTLEFLNLHLLHHKRQIESYLNERK